MLSRILFQLRRRIRHSAGFYGRPARQPFTRESNPQGLRCDPIELGRFVNHRLVPLVGAFPYPPNELMLMCSALLWLRPRLVVEYGTNIGVSARVFWETSKHYDLHTVIHSIDLPSDSAYMKGCTDWTASLSPARARGILVKNLGVHLHEGDGVETAVKLIREENAEDPLVFIDGDHAKESVLREASAIWSNFPKASILFHDTFEGLDCKSGAREALRELLANRSDRPLVYDLPVGHPGMTLVVPERDSKRK